MKLLSCGESRHIKSCIEHTHNCFEIVITIQGANTTTIAGSEFSVSRGSVAVIPPQVPHSHYSSTEFSDMFVQITDILLPDEVNVFKDTTHEIATIAKIIYTNYIQKDSNYKTILQYLTGAFYECLIKYYGSGHKYEFVSQLKNILAHNMSDSQFVISDAVKKIGISYEYMRHCFKEETGQTPLEYLTAMRIRQAKQYLTTAKYYSVSDIAFMCGFSDSYYFSRCFKKHTGISPYNYRKS